MSMKLEEFARESRATHKGDKSGVPIVGLEHLIPQEIKFSGYDVDTENTFTKTFKKGQILFGRRRAYLKKAAIADFDGICSGDITVIEAIPGKVDPLLLPFIIQNDKFFDYAVSRSAGGLSPRVKWEHLKDYEFDLPPIEEQRILADKLWAAYRLKESYKKLLTATQEMVKSQDIDYHNRECIVTGKGDKQRKVYFDARTKIHLQKYINSRTDSNEALFVSLLAPYERLQISGVEIRLRQMGKDLNIPKVHPHKFRRTLATMAIDKGMPIEQVQHLLGHQSLDTTLQYAMVNQNNVKLSHHKFIG
jgi:hypothetical protein